MRPVLLVLRDLGLRFDAIWFSCVPFFVGRILLRLPLRFFQLIRPPLLLIYEPLLQLLLFLILLSPSRLGLVSITAKFPLLLFRSPILPLLSSFAGFSFFSSPLLPPLSSCAVFLPLLLLSRAAGAWTDLEGTVSDGDITPSSTGAAAMRVAGSDGSSKGL